MDYCGIFSIRGFEEEQLKALLGSVCPSILFPYVREVVGDIVMRGSFPQLILAPVNFDALYATAAKQRISITYGDSSHRRGSLGYGFS